MSEHPDAPHVSVATINAAVHGGAAPATDNGGRLTGPCAVRALALVDEAIGSDASARIAADILAIAQGVTNTQADLDILRNGVSDITEALENKIRDMWELLQAELKKERELYTILQDSFRERRISDHETLEEHFARLNSMVNDRFIEFDERIHRFNEKRAGSISMQLADTIRHIKHYPDALQQIQINISNAEARIAAVEQNATHRIEVIRSEMSRALYDHKESNRVLIDQLTARIQHLESAQFRRGGSDMSTPSRPERAQFFDISDHDGDISRPADLPPVPGALFPGGQTTATPRSSLLGPIDHGSPPGCNAAPAEKASTVHSQTSGINLDEILRRAQQRVADEHLGESREQNNPVEPVRQNYGQTSASFSGTSPDPAVPPADAAGAIPGQAPSLRPNPVDDALRTDVRPIPEARSFAPEPRDHRDGTMQILHSETGTFTLAPHTTVTTTLRPTATIDAMPPMPTFEARTSVPAPTAAPSATAPTITGVRMAAVLVAMAIKGPASDLVAVVVHLAGLPAVRRVTVALLVGVVRPTVALIRRASGPLGDRVGAIRSSASAALELSQPRCDGYAFPADSHAATDVAATRGSKGDGSLSDAKKAKCKSFRLDPEPEPAQLRRWIVDMKERVANAFAYDPAYALSWVEIPDGARYEDFLEECKYVSTECSRTSAIRQILWLLYDFLRPHVTGDSTFKLVDVVKTTIDRFTHGTEQERLEAFTNRWDHVLAGISVDRPEDPFLCALFYEQVREFRCLELDMQLWDRDVSVRNYAYLRTVCINAITTWRRRRNQEKMYTATRSSSAQRRYAAFVAQTILTETWLAEAVLSQPRKSCPCANAPVAITIPSRAMTASSYGDFAFACAASFDMACPSLKWKTVSFGNTETRVIESSFPEPVFGPVNRERNLNYSWPEDIRGLNSAREKRRAHMKAVLWREQVLLDDVDAKTLGNDACVLELTLSKRSACEVFAAAVKSVKRVRRLMLDSGCGVDLIGLGDLSREVDVINNIPYLAPSETEVVAGRPDLPRVYPALPAPIIVHEKVAAAGEEPADELDDIGELDRDMPGVKGADKNTPDDAKRGHGKPKPQSPPDEPRARDLKEEAKSIRHLMTHLPKNTAAMPANDTMVLHGLGNRGNNGETDAVVFYDLATEWLESVPVKGRTNADTLRAFQQVFGDLKDVNSFSMDVERRYAPSEVREIYCDKAREFISTCKKVGISVKHSTPGMPRTDAIAESKVKLVLHGARVALRQAGLSAKFWPYACKHFCHARNIEMREGQSAYTQRFNGAEFDGQILPFGCLVDFYPTPARKQTRRSQRDEVVLGDGEECAVPAPGADGLIDVEGTDVDQRPSSYQRPSKFSPTSKPGIFRGYHFENGGKWDGDYIVTDLEDFKRDALRASVHQVKTVYCSPKERWTFPMLAVYDKQTRSVCVNDPAMLSTVPKPSERLDASDMLELEDNDEIFALDEPTRMTDDDIRQAREAELRAESSHGGVVDYWEYDPSMHKWTYHVVVPRKAMVHPSKTPGSIGESPDPWKLSTVRISHVQYKDKSPVTIYETGYAFGKTRLMQLWTGTVEFFDDGFAPPKKKLPPYHGSAILEGEGSLPYRESVCCTRRPCLISGHRFGIWFQNDGTGVPLAFWASALEIQHCPPPPPLLDGLPAGMPPIRTVPCVVLDCARCAQNRRGFQMPFVGTFTHAAAIVRPGRDPAQAWSDCHTDRSYLSEADITALHSGLWPTDLLPNHLHALLARVAEQTHPRAVTWAELWVIFRRWQAGNRVWIEPGRGVPSWEAGREDPRARALAVAGGRLFWARPASFGVPQLRGPYRFQVPERRRRGGLRRLPGPLHPVFLSLRRSGGSDPPFIILGLGQRLRSQPLAGWRPPNPEKELHSGFVRRWRPAWS
ncbi:JNK [Symbiodinium sp. CCMP2592]|nr:JNK [Symbiodinium sp. CCMP2592]